MLSQRPVQPLLPPSASVWERDGARPQAHCENRAPGGSGPNAPGKICRTAGLMKSIPNGRKRTPKLTKQLGQHVLQLHKTRTTLLIGPLCSREGHFILPAQSYKQHQCARVSNGPHLKCQLQLIGCGCLALKGCQGGFTYYVCQAPQEGPSVGTSDEFWPYIASLSLF